MIKEVRLEKRNVNKISLIITKFIPHLGAFGYIIYTLFGFYGIDLNLLGSFIHLSLLYLIYLLIDSIRFKFCYVHRLPLYYIALNEIITEIDYYFNIQDDVIQLMVIHILLVALLIFGYSYYYVKFRLKNVVANKNRFLAIH